ncbi:hypothetical protein [Vagococcus carniphilus]|uniref:hypothetical protein n=1 Tax=Vagococcus carniphilus TaxID=218144 RepID=UPI003B5A53CC
MSKIYLIKPNKLKENQILIDISYFTEGCYGLYFADAEVVETGDINELENLKAFLRQADYIFLWGEMDSRSYFELGLCYGLEVPIYVLDDNPNFDTSHLNLELDLEIKSIRALDFIEKEITD